MIRCCVCSKQAVDGQISSNDPFLTTLIGSRAAFRCGECYCGYCAKDLDENGIFPEELYIDQPMVYSHIDP